ncbi:general secretion pathway protein E/type IV pilus assembly protein PilB [Parapedobacter composti]|uniref:General secretion pathway protein E/type IV pilus assembly protein PilB n=1 Tax=Parapedobacter composti TaxID=623281 RepID=A0A1I1MBZ4_9SPHI|nr:GspE/PulE family protein [Parapedobacter composti]SFC82626.1 general secretion pathway protein E/type IV pilus assembly protein PilB [Parapedobacter composti]
MEELHLNTADLKLMSAQQAWHYRVIPQRENGRVLCYTDRETDMAQVKEELEMLLGMGVELKAAPRDAVTKYLSKFYLREDAEQHAAAGQYLGASADFLSDLIAEARRLKSSDIHLEVYEERCRVRIRIDGLMIERYRLEKREYPAVINKIKILSGLDIAEKRLPQDGRINFDNGQYKFDIRVSILPTLHGEKVVLRLLNNDAANISLDTLGFSPADLRHYLEGVQRPNGIVLISGPTGSGKTTTLYATLKLLNKETRNILTIEDPIEYTLEGINQVQLKESIGLTFASALRTFLRQDPDVIMVGEIRDVETAAMAIRAALTGHLVLSTIHTNSAWGTVSRLIDMGVPPFLLANTLNTTAAQRLVRLLCPACKEEVPFSDALYPRNFVPYKRIHSHYVAKGCDQCHHTGYRGRAAVYEIIPIDQALAAKIKRNEHDIQEKLAELNIKTLAQNAFELFSEGKTSIEEIYPLLFSF